MKISRETESVAIARNWNISRQVKKANIISRGAVAATAPSPPIARKLPLIRGQWRSSNQIVAAFTAPIKQPATPSPIKPLPRAKTVVFVPRENSTAPPAANNRSNVCTLRGPYLSSKIPKGI